MAGRNRQPIDVIVAKGKKHLTKAEIEARKDSEIRLGDSGMVCPEFIVSDPVAFAKWEEIMILYKDIDFVSSGDVGHLARYCKTHSEYIDLLERLKIISQMEPFKPEEEMQIVGEFATHMGEIAAAKMFQKFEYIMSTGGIINMHKAINSKMAALVAMEDRLFLNPLSKIKNVPKKEVKEETDPLKAAGFPNV